MTEVTNYVFITQQQKETLIYTIYGFPRWLCGEEPAFQCRRHGLCPWEDPLEEEMATHSSILAWRIPWTEEPDRLQSKGSQKRHDLGSKL